MIDQEKWIGAQAVMKSLIENSPSEIITKTWDNLLELRFKFCMKLMEDYATLPEDEEWINTEISIPKNFWNQDPKGQTDWLTEWGKPMPIVDKVGRKQWFIHAKRANLKKVKEVFDKREAEFVDMTQVQEKKKEEVTK